MSAGQTRGKLALPSAVDVRLRRSLNELRSSKFEQRSNDDLCMRSAAEKALKSKAGSTQRVWEGYAERHAIAQASHPDSTKRYGKEKLSFFVSIVSWKHSREITEGFSVVLGVGEAELFRYFRYFHIG